MKLKGSEAIVKVLMEQGVDTVFGYPGGAVIPLFDALYSSPIKRILTAHEQGAIHAADGYARASGKTGVCIATSGPGATNIVTGLATAYLDSIPVVAITGQVGVSLLGRDSFQEIDIVGVTMPVTKYNMLVRSKDELLPCLRKAFKLAQEGRPGPVLVDVPVSVTTETLEWIEPKKETRMKTRAKVDAEALTEAAAALNQAARPLLLVGGGAVNSGAQAELLELAARADLPVVTTLMGVGVFPAQNERALGLTGMHGHICSNLAVVNADVLVVAGSRFSDRVTGDRKSYVGKKTIIQLDIDPSEVDKNIEAGLAIIGDVKDTLAALLPLVREATHPDWWEMIRGWDKTEDRSLLSGDRLTAPLIMEELNRSFEDADPIYVTDVGQNQMWAAQYLHVNKPRHHLTSGGCGTMGFGLPGALGAAFACPEAKVIHICGDGGFKMTGMELYTASREHKNLLSIVVNNSCLGMVRQWQQLFYNEHYSSTLLTEFDFIGFARAAGGDGARATTPEEFAAAVELSKKSDRPFVIEAVIDQNDLVEPMVAAGAAVDDFVKIPHH